MLFNDEKLEDITSETMDEDLENLAVKIMKVWNIDPEKLPKKEYEEAVNVFRPYKIIPDSKLLKISLIKETRVILPLISAILMIIPTILTAYNYICLKSELFNLNAMILLGIAGILLGVYSEVTRKVINASFIMEISGDVDISHASFAYTIFGISDKNLPTSGIYKLIPAFGTQRLFLYR